MVSRLSSGAVKTDCGITVLLCWFSGRTGLRVPGAVDGGERMFQ
jgi:hypothetical protein